LNLIERQNQQIRQYMAPQEKQTTGRNRVVLKKIELLEKILREEDLAKKKNAQSPVMDLFFIQNMIQGSNTMLQSVSEDPKAGGKDGGQDVIQKFMLMKLMETMGKGNQQQMPQYQEKEVTVIAEESAKEDSEEDSDEMPDMTGRVGVTSPEKSDMPSPDAGQGLGSDVSPGLSP
jgi:molybdenum-dependent DNA-binding transcriptional regulator ModE